MFSELLSNPVFNGVVGGSLVASGMYALKGVPSTLWSFLSWRYSTEVTLYNDDAAFEMVSEWLGANEYARRARKIRLTSKFSEDDQRDEIRTAPGAGTHLIWHESRPVIIKRWVDEKSSNVASQKLREGITIRTLGSTPDHARRIIAEIVDRQSGTGSKFVSVYLYRYSWRLACRKEKRALESVVIPAVQRNRIVVDIERFRASREWYRERGIPYRRGLLFAGTPGCGKTSLVMALASHFSMRIYALNLGSMKSDDDLIEAVTSVPENAILLIEDIDAAQRSRVPSEATKSDKGSGPTVAAEELVTLSGLLNAIDGVFSRDGRVLIMTTNHPEKLDPALKRPGRADRIETIGPIGPAEVREMCRQFLGSNLAAERFAASVKTPIRPADLQRDLLMVASGENEAIREVEAA